ncbi:hypothetical protein HJG60_009168 [Phyllostomus discolor]|uniref:Uncharacterized protein n=1 Tax=Phyllostomus discolor TaxID=89673 RepID=A0A833YFM6_9CHIR|nr:hypothetical protein HJG60_009168 [Phyllostomus discolor]
MSLGRETAAPAEVRWDPAGQTLPAIAMPQPPARDGTSVPRYAARVTVKTVSHRRKPTPRDPASNPGHIGPRKVFLSTTEVPAGHCCAGVLGYNTSARGCASSGSGSGSGREAPHLLPRCGRAGAERAGCRPGLRLRASADKAGSKRADGTGSAGGSYRLAEHGASPQIHGRAPETAPGQD